MMKKVLAFVAMMYAAMAFAAVDVNKATAADLDGIKGIGPGISAKILDERKKGAFKDWNDLITRVNGVGETNAANFSKEGMTVNGSAFAGAAPAAKKDDKPMAKKDEKPAAKKEEKPMAKADEKKAEAKPVAAAAADKKEEKKEAKKDAKADKAEAKAKKDDDKKAKAADDKVAKADKKDDKKDKKADKKDAKADVAKDAASAAKK